MTGLTLIICAGKRAANCYSRLCKYPWQGYNIFSSFFCEPFNLQRESVFTVLVIRESLSFMLFFTASVPPDVCSARTDGLTFKIRV